jgi:hypothetical protein
MALGSLLNKADARQAYANCLIEHFYWLLQKNSQQHNHQGKNKNKFWAVYGNEF